MHFPVDLLHRARTQRVDHLAEQGAVLEHCVEVILALDWKWRNIVYVCLLSLRWL